MASQRAYNQVSAVVSFIYVVLILAFNLFYVLKLFWKAELQLGHGGPLSESEKQMISHWKLQSGELFWHMSKNS